MDKVLNEVLLGAKLMRDEENVEMLGYILPNKQYCWGNGYYWSDGLSKVLQKQVQENAFTVASGMKSVIQSAQTALDDLLAKIEEQP